MRRVTDDEHAEMRRLRAEGKTFREIADVMNVGLSTVEDHVRGVDWRKARRRTNYSRNSHADEIVALWNEGRTVAEIAEACGISKPSVKSFVHRHRHLCPSRFVKVSESEKDELFRLYDDGRDLDYIASYFGMSKGTVYRHVREREKGRADGRR